VKLCQSLDMFSPQGLGLRYTLHTGLRKVLRLRLRRAEGGLGDFPAMPERATG